MEGTMVRIDKRTAKKIKENKITKLESYDEILVRMLNENDTKSK